MGIALSDELGMLAHPHPFIAAEPFTEFLKQLKVLLKNNEVEQILVGMPRNMDGSYGSAALKVQGFVAVLRESIVTPIKMWDERLTSTQANRMLSDVGIKKHLRREKVDGMAAAILLQSYLESISG